MNLTKKKYLVVLAGSLRGGERAWESLYKYVIDHLDADLAICIGDKFYKKNSLVTKSTYKWIFKEPDNWSKYFSERFSNTWKEYLLLGQEFGMAGGLDNFSGSGAIVSGLKNIIHENYLSVLKNYEYIEYT